MQFYLKTNMVCTRFLQVVRTGWGDRHWSDLAFEFRQWTCAGVRICHGLLTWSGGHGTEEFIIELQHQAVQHPVPSIHLRRTISI
jgi:hypothetical protein